MDLSAEEKIYIFLPVAWMLRKLLKYRSSQEEKLLYQELTAQILGGTKYSTHTLCVTESLGRDSNVSAMARICPSISKDELDH